MKDHFLASGERFRLQVETKFNTHNVDSAVVD